MQLVSIIIPVYNGEKFIQKALETILSQTYANTEIIVVDDASTDATVDIVRMFRQEKIKLLQQPNAGAAVARNTGLKHARGSYIQFMDADDYLSPDKIEKQVLALNGEQDKIAVCNYINFFEDDDLKESLTPETQDPFIYSTDDTAAFLVNLLGGNGNSNFIQTNCWLVPITLIYIAGEWRNYRCPDDDGEFFARVLLAAAGVVYVPGVYNFYRRSMNENKLSQNSNKKYIQNVLLTIDLKYKYLLNYNVQDINKAFALQYLMFAVHQYPQQRLLSALSFRKYKELNYKAQLPKLGGRVIQLMAILFGWKFTRNIKYVLAK